MWAGMLHMVIGNALIGIAEGMFVAFIFKTKRKLCVPVMIVANYLSAWVGGLLLTQFLTPHLDINLYNGRLWMVLLTAITFIATVILELPFVLFCARGIGARRTKIIQVNCLVQFVSYLILTLWYLSASRVSLYSKFEVLPSSRIVVNEEALLYYIAGPDGNVYSSRLDGSERQQVFALQSTNHYDRLFVKKNGSNQWDLMFQGGGDRQQSQTLTLTSNLTSSAVEDPRTDNGKAEGTWFNFGAITSLANSNEWDFVTGFWAAEGIHGKNSRTGERLHCSFETPFLNWFIRNGTQLPNEQVVFQLGKDQICILDPKFKTIALVARGRGPVVALQSRPITQ
ncbi:MAG: hypothetical protein JWM68_4444 [Verrucomicrobiales bacterium]|nr:hypothetical protein [Verrucomicrobiales bacterium]